MDGQAKCTVRNKTRPQREMAARMQEKQGKTSLKNQDFLEKQRTKSPDIDEELKIMKKFIIGIVQRTCGRDTGDDLLEANVARRITTAIASTPGVLETSLMPEGMTWLDFITPHLQLRERTAATVDASAGTITANGGSWQADSDGNWRMDPSRAWLAENFDGGGHPAGESPALFVDTNASGSFTDQYGEVDYTVAIANDHVQVNYSGTYQQEGLPPQDRSMSAALSVELFGVREDNAKPHTLDGGSGADTLIAGDGGDGIPFGDTLIGGVGSDLIQGGQGDDLAWGDDISRLASQRAIPAAADDASHEILWTRRAA